MRSLLSIVRLTLANAVRMRIAIVIIVFLAVVIPTLPFILKTDETQVGHVQITLTYSLGMLFLLLSVMTIFIGCASISNEIAGGQMQLLDTKPVRRWQIILGKWLGIMVLNTALIILLGGAAFGLTRFIGRASAAPDTEAPEAQKSQHDLRNSVFTGRVTMKPELPDGIEEAVILEYETRRQEGRLPEGWKEDEYKDHLRQLELKRAGVVPFGTEKVWTFKNIELDREDEKSVFFIRYKVRTTETRTDRMFSGIWMFGGTYDPGEGRDPIEKYGTVQVTETTGSPHELEVPAFVIKPDKTLDIVFLNATTSDDGQRGISVTFNPDEGLELLYRRTGFFTNYVRHFLIILAILGFMAMLSVVSSSFLSFPVAALLVFSIILNAYGLGTFKEFAYATDPATIATTGQKIGKGAAKVVYNVLAYIMPDLTQYTTLGKLNSGIYISTGLVLKSVLVLVVLFGGIIYAIGCVIFAREELG
jgi:hypothetical protein